jgi:hypothetical protein
MIFAGKREFSFSFFEWMVVSIGFVSLVSSADDEARSYKREMYKSSDFFQKGGVILSFASEKEIELCLGSW